MKKSIIYILLLIIIAFLLWLWWQSNAELAKERLERKDLMDSLSKIHLDRDIIPDNPTYQLLSDTGATTTTVVALDKANRGIPNVLIFVSKQQGSSWVVFEEGSTTSEGRYRILTNGVVGGMIPYRIRAKNGTIDDQTHELVSDLVLPFHTFKLKN